MSAAEQLADVDPRAAAGLIGWSGMETLGVQTERTDLSEAFADWAVVTRPP